MVQLLARRYKEKTPVSFPASNVLELAKELWDAWNAAKMYRVAVVVQERGRQ